MGRYRTPIAHLTEAAILEQPRLTQDVIASWVCQMIDARWKLVFDPATMFVHADEYTSVIDFKMAEKLLNLYWKELKIPDPYNYLELAARTPRKLIHAEPDRL